jgi:hypothetical protein
VERACERFYVSERRACRVVRQARSTAALPAPLQGGMRSNSPPAWWDCRVCMGAMGIAG